MVYKSILQKLFVVILALFCGCKSDNKKNNLTECVSNNHHSDCCHCKIENQKIDVDTNKKAINRNVTIEPEPGIITEKYNGGICNLFVYTPYKLNYHISNKRPELKKNIYLSIAAALTLDYNHNICGLFIINGKEVSPDNDQYTGGCIINKNSIKIIDNKDFTKKLKDDLIAKNESYFENGLLIYNNNTIPWILPNGDIPRQRRAIIELNNKFAVCESDIRLDIATFQKALVNIGVKNAIYTDMGGWSEGWYRSIDGKIIKIGEDFKATEFQSNWIYFTKDLY